MKQTKELKYQDKSKAVVMLVRKGAKYLQDKNAVDVSNASNLGSKSQGAIDYLRKVGVTILGEMKYRVFNNPFYVLNKMLKEGRMDYDTFKHHQANIGAYNKALGY